MLELLILYVFSDIHFCKRKVCGQSGFVPFQDTSFEAQINVEDIFLYPCHSKFFQEVRCCFQSLTLKYDDSFLCTHNGFFQKDCLHFILDHCFCLSYCFLKSPSKPWVGSLNSIIHIDYLNNPSHLSFSFCFSRTFQILFLMSLIQLIYCISSILCSFK